MNLHLIIGFALTSLSLAEEPARVGAKEVTLDPATSLRFREPVYPEGADVALLPELVTYYDERIDRHTKEDWGNFLVKMQQAKLPRLAEKQDLRITRDEIENLSDKPLLIVVRHLHPLAPQRSMNLDGVEYRVYWLKPKEKLIKRDLGFGHDCTVLAPSLR